MANGSSCYNLMLFEFYQARRGCALREFGWGSFMGDGEISVVGGLGECFFEYGEFSNLELVGSWKYIIMGSEPENKNYRQPPNSNLPAIRTLPPKKLPIPVRENQ